MESKVHFSQYVIGIRANISEKGTIATYPTSIETEQLTISVADKQR